MKRLLAILLLLPSVALADAEPPVKGCKIADLGWHQGRKITVNTPKGWEVDAPEAAAQCIDGVYRPIDSSIDAVIFVEGIEVTKPTLEETVAWDIGDLMKGENEQTRIEEMELKLLPGKNTLAKKVIHGAGGQFPNARQVLVYVEEKKLTPQFILIAQGDEALNHALPGFKQLVKSYLLIPTEPKTD